MLITLDTAKTFMKVNRLKLSIVYPKTKWNHFRLEQDLTIKISTGEFIYIEKGFEFDGSSSPRFLWSLFPSYGDFLFAALIHDWMYKTDYLRSKLGVKSAQKLADNEMLLWSNVLNDNKIDNHLRYYAVRLFGKRVYIN